MTKYIIQYASRSEVTPVEGAVRTNESWRTAWSYETDDLASLIKKLGDVIVYPSREENDTWGITIYDDYVE